MDTDKSEITPEQREFRTLFWAARKEHKRQGETASADDPAHQAAVAFAQSRDWIWATELLEASRLERAEGKPETALALLSVSKEKTPSAFHGYVAFVTGAALHSKGELDEAIEAYRKALNDPTFDMPGEAWNSLGIALRGKGELDAAIEAHRKALDDPTYDTPGYAWNNLGNALRDKGELDEAIAAHRKALDDPTYDRPGKAWNNLGNALGDKGERDKAIAAYREALDDPAYDTPVRAWVNLAITHRQFGDNSEAQKAAENALAADDPAGEDHARAHRLLSIVKSDLKSTALSEDDRATVESSTSSEAAESPEDRIIGKISEAAATQYDHYLERQDSGRDNVLSILRGWSSAVTLLEGSERRWRGGGLFLKWRGCGIVIDPGFDFLRNFHDRGFHGREINVVLVSHNHPDHNSDLNSVDDLRYELYKRLASTKEPGGQPYVLLWDQDTEHATKLAGQEPQHHEEPIVFPSGYPQPVDLSKHPCGHPLRVKPFKVNHGSDVPHAMGFVVELLDEHGEVASRIGYTGDTGYFGELPTHLAECDILVAHISQPSIKELKDPKELKDVHLGYRGVTRLIKECEPRFALIGEFWAGFADLRVDLTKGIRMRSGLEHVFPAGLGLHVHLPSMDVECTECHKSVLFDRVNVAPPSDEFGDLAYLCPSCIL